MMLPLLPVKQLLWMAVSTGLDKLRQRKFKHGEENVYDIKYGSDSGRRPTTESGGCKPG
jgi:hypothetical protein